MDIKKTFKYLQRDYQVWYKTYQEIAEYINGKRGNFSNPKNNTRLIDGKKIIDNEAGKCINIFSAGMMSGLTSPSRKWFKLKLKNYNIGENDEIKKWLYKVENLMYDIFNSSNIYSVLSNIYEEIAIFGTACALLQYDPKKIIKGRSFTAGEYFLGANSKGDIDTFCRQYYMTVKQMIEEFGKDKVSEHVKNLYDEGKYNEYIEINMMIAPNTNYYEGSNQFKYLSYYWESSDSEEGKFLAIKGYRNFPLVCPRWDLITTSDVYGISPSWDALPDVKMLQKLQKDKLIAIDKMINPPVEIDGTAQVTSLNLMPSGITRVSGFSPDAKVRPIYQIQLDMNAIQLVIEETRQRIKRDYYNDLFLSITNINKSNVTATEISERYEEKLLMLGVVLERLKTELLNPLIERTYFLMGEAGILPEIPDALHGQEIEVEFISILAQAQKMVGLSSLERTTSFVASIIPANPEVLDVFDMDKAVRIHADMTGVDPEVLRDPKEVEQIRSQRREVQLQQMQLENTMQMSKVAKNLASAKMTGDDLISKMTGESGGI